MMKRIFRTNSSQAKCAFYWNNIMFVLVQKSKKRSIVTRANSETITNLFSSFLSFFLFRFGHFIPPEITKWRPADFFHFRSRCDASYRWKFVSMCWQINYCTKVKKAITSRSSCFDEEIRLRFVPFYFLFHFSRFTKKTTINESWNAFQYSFNLRFQTRHDGLLNKIYHNLLKNKIVCIFKTSNID